MVAPNDAHLQYFGRWDKSNAQEYQCAQGAVYIKANFTGTSIKAKLRDPNDKWRVSIDGGADLTKLVGRKGEVLDALQELTRLAVHQKTGERSRLMLDIAGWRRRRREELTALGDEVARRVAASGQDEELAPMSPFERKIVHDAVAAVDGVHSESEGVEPSRRVVVRVG